MFSSEDTNFQQQCIFCRYTARGNRSKIIHHLYMIHHLNLGSPDNLVFVTEYIEHLKDKLQVRTCCIFVFRSCSSFCYNNPRDCVKRMLKTTSS